MNLFSTVSLPFDLLTSFKILNATLSSSLLLLALSAVRCSISCSISCVDTISY